MAESAPPDVLQSFWANIQKDGLKALENWSGLSADKTNLGADQAAVAPSTTPPWMQPQFLMVAAAVVVGIVAIIFLSRK